MNKKFLIYVSICCFIMLFLIGCSSPIKKIKSEIIFYGAEKKIFENSYVIKNIEFRGYTYEEDGIEIRYIDKFRQENFFKLKMSKQIIDYMKEHNPVICSSEGKIITMSDFKLILPKEIDYRNKFYCYRLKKEIFIFSELNERDLTNIFLLYIEVQGT